MLNLNCLRYLSMVLLISPLIACISLPAISKFIKPDAWYFKKTISAINLFFIGISVGIAFYLLWFYYFVNPNTLSIVWYKLAHIKNINLEFGFLLDDLNIIMLTMIAIMSFVIQIYSIDYMNDNFSYSRFSSYMCFFIFSMFLLVVANNFLQLFFGWELVGCSSYLLINYYFQEESARSAAFKAIIYNRIGDCALILAIAATFNYCGSLNYLEVFQNLPSSIQNLNLICGLFVIAAMAKSAQVPLHAWLPDAMQGPTPASALIHSATMVTAGVFILVRLSPMLEKSTYWLNMILIVGSTTGLSMGLLAMIETDLKKIIAYSTISQLGIMMVAIGGSAYVAALFHLINHAFFKSLLLLSIGSILLATNQNHIHKLPATLKMHLPVAYWSILISCMSSSGLPGFSGFFSKELICKAIINCNLSFSTIAYYMLLITTFITAFYNFRLFFLIFYNNNHQTINLQKEIIISRLKMIFGSIVFLAVFSLLSGILLFSFVANNKLFSANIIISGKQQFVNAWELLKYKFFSATSITVFCAIMVSFVLYIKKINFLNAIGSRIKENFLFLYKILKNQYFFNHANKLLIMVFKFLSKISYQIIDQLLLDKIVINTLSKVVVNCSKFTQKLQTGHLYDYIFLTLLGALLIISWLFFTII